jgi:hypothetical protein
LANAASKVARASGVSHPHRRHPVDVLFAKRQSPAACAFFVAEVAVGVEVTRQSVGCFAQGLGALFAGPAGQIDFGGRPGGCVDPAWQGIEEPADDRHVGVADVPGPLGGRGGRIPRRERLAGQRLAGAQIARLADPAIGFAAGDAQPVGQHVGELPADLCRSGLALDLVDQLISGHRQSAHFAFQPFEVGDSVAGGQCLVGVPDDARDHLVQRREIRGDLLVGTRMHVHTLWRTTDKDYVRTWIMIAAPKQLKLMWRR